MSHAKLPAYTITHSGVITLHSNGKVYTASKTHSNYDAIVKAVKSKKFKGIDKLFNVGAVIEKRSRKTLKLEKGKLTYGGKPLHHVVVDRVMYFMKEEFDFKPLVNFLKNLLQNPSENSVAQLYGFVERNNLPITWDGYILCYKAVNSEFKDFNSGTFDNSVGKTVSMPRDQVVDDPNTACGPGLHVGGLVYLNWFQDQGHKGHVLLVKVHPKDVVSVPKDHNEGKCRTCKYTVLSVYEGSTEVPQSDVSAGSVDKDVYASEHEEDYDVCPDCGEYDCVCEDERCDDCGEYLDDCTCEEEFDEDDNCSNCGHAREYCDCDE